MKIKSKLNKISNFNAMNVPCSNLEFGQLRDGKSIEVDDEDADKVNTIGDAVQMVMAKTT